MSDIEKIRQEIERRKGYISVMHFAEDILAFIDSLQQEQPDADLEKAMYAKATSECDIIWNEMDFQLCYDNLIEAFVAGAEWAMKWKEEEK